MQDEENKGNEEENIEFSTEEVSPISETFFNEMKANCDSTVLYD